MSTSSPANDSEGWFSPPFLQPVNPFNQDPIPGNTPKLTQTTGTVILAPRTLQLQGVESRLGKQKRTPGWGLPTTEITAASDTLN